MVALVVALGVGFWTLRGQHSVHVSTAAAENATQPPAVPVTVVQADVRDVPVYLRGLGTVQAFNVVGVKAQVNGMLIAIPVQEGQGVHQGDVVAQIDLRPYQAILDQATAQRAEDAAQLQSAQLDLQRYQNLAKHQFAPVLAIVLVVMVIFLFLRNLWATIIPSVTIPVALAGTLGAMYLCGFSLDNLSLMGLTIAVGFVVDDAIVMLENIFRHIENGMKPMDAAIKGAGEIGFTIISISFSLIAVFIPLLLMGGIVGRLFREFAICVSMTIVISAIVSLTLTPMMASRFLSAEAHEHGRIYNAIERMFAADPGLL